MEKSRFTTKQTIGTLRTHVAGATPTDLVRRHNVSRQIFSSWKKRIAGLQDSDAKRLKVLKDVNARFRRRVADEAPNLRILKYVLG